MTECWIFAGTTDRSGYPQVSYKGKTDMVHRLIYKMYHGEISKGIEIDHLCEVTTCINPEHLEATTPAENTRRSPTISTINASKTHCSSGHEFSIDNTYLYKGKWRQCRTCISIRMKKSYQLNKLRILI